MQTRQGREKPPKKVTLKPEDGSKLSVSKSQKFMITIIFHVTNTHYFSHLIKCIKIGMNKVIKNKDFFIHQNIILTKKAYPKTRT